MAQTGRERTRDGGVYGSAVGAAGWQRGSAGRADLRPITDRMLDLAGIRPGHRVLDVAAGTGEQTLMAARRVGPDGFVLATTGSSRQFAATQHFGRFGAKRTLTEPRLLKPDSRGARNREVPTTCRPLGMIILFHAGLGETQCWAKRKILSLRLELRL
jgi:hypothetical protein